MIVTVTMNPALDKTAHVETFVVSGLNRLQGVRVDAGGKGINVSKLIHVLGGQSLCTGFIGGDSGQELRRRTKALGLTTDFVTVESTTRTNLKVMDAGGNLTELNEPGVSVTEREVEALLEKVLSLAGKDGIVVLSGSLPQGAEPATYQKYAMQLRAAGCRVLVDADGESFRHALKAAPHVIKPNRFELLQYYGLPQETPDSCLPDLCKPFLDAGVEWVVLSMGGDGALFLTRDNAARAPALSVQVRSTVGAGDCMVGAMAYALEQSLSFPETVRLAMAASIGGVTTEGTNPPSLSLIEELKRQIILEPLDGN